MKTLRFNIKQLLTILLFAVALAVPSSLQFSSTASAVTCPDKGTADKTSDCCSTGTEPECFQAKSDAATVDCSKLGSTAQSGVNCTDSTCTQQNCNLISKYVNPLITLLSAAVGVAVTVSIVIGGIQYSSSGGDPQKVTAAKNRIRNSIIALVAFLFLFAFLQFIVPGGIFNS